MTQKLSEINIRLEKALKYIGLSLVFKYMIGIIYLLSLVFLVTEQVGMFFVLMLVCVGLGVTIATVDILLMIHIFKKVK